MTVNGKEVHVTHITADGKTRETMAGYLTSAEQLPPAARQIILHLLEKGKG